MCYGARCKDYLSANVNHQGMIPQSDLVTSFAYRLYHALVHDHSIKARLSAVTGKIAYRLKGATLTIVSKYGDSSTSLAPGTVLYLGPLLTPG